MVIWLRTYLCECLVSPLIVTLGFLETKTAGRPSSSLSGTAHWSVCIFTQGPAAKTLILKLLSFPTRKASWWGNRYFYIFDKNVIKNRTLHLSYLWKFWSGDWAFMPRKKVWTNRRVWEILWSHLPSPVAAALSTSACVAAESRICIAFGTIRKWRPQKFRNFGSLPPLSAVWTDLKY